MTSSEKILAGIIDEANSKADMILAEAEKKVAQFNAEEDKKAESAAQQCLANAESKAKIIENTGKSSALLLKRDISLSRRRELIDKVLNEVVEVINSYDDNKYFNYLLSMIEKNALPKSGEILLSSRDLSRNITDFKDKIQQFNLKVSEKPIEIQGGFILKYNDILINGELKALIHEKREQLVDTVNTVLFS